MVKGLFCFRLQTAGLLVGWAGAVSYSVWSIINIVLLTKVDYLADQVNITLNNSDIAKDHDAIKFALEIIFTLNLVFDVINAICSVILIFGTKMEKHLYLLPWLFTNAIYLLLGVLGCVIAIACLITAKVEFVKMLIPVMFVFISFGFNLYVWLAIQSLYKLFRNTSDRQRLLSHTGAQHPSYTSI